MFGQPLIICFFLVQIMLSFQVLEEIEKKLTEKQRSQMHWKIAEVEDGYKGENISLNTSGYKQEKFTIIPENFPLNASAPTDL